jgi:hypothetical protein
MQRTVVFRYVMRVEYRYAKCIKCRYAMPVIDTPNVLHVDTPCLAYLHWGISTLGHFYIWAYLHRGVSKAWLICKTGKRLNIMRQLKSHACIPAFLPLA